MKKEGTRQKLTVTALWGKMANHCEFAEYDKMKRRYFCGKTKNVCDYHVCPIVKASA